MIIAQSGSTRFKRQIGILLTAVAVALFAFLLLAFSPAASGQPAKPLVDRGSASAPRVAGELLVAYEEEAPDRVSESVRGESGARVKDELTTLDTQLVEFPGIKNQRTLESRTQSLEQMKKKLEGDPAVESVEYNYIRQPSFKPNDPRFGEQYGFRKPGFPVAWNTELGRTASGRAVRIGVVDSGIASHPDLRRKIAAQRDFVNGDSRAEDQSPEGHGTHVAGTAAASTDNGTGVAGGCPRCRLLIAKAVGPFFGEDADIARGIVWSTNRGAKVINLSLGGPGRSAILKNAVDYATNRGVVVVAAAGNEDTDTLTYPAAYSNVIAVAATNRSDRRASFSNFGNWVDVAAPGVDILSTVPGGYARFDGTSMSSPHVAALAGLLSAQGRNRNEIRSRILNTAVDLGADGRDRFYGAGRINAARAVGR